MVGQNLPPRLVARGCTNVVILDKGPKNLNIKRKMYPHIAWEYACLTKPAYWRFYFNRVRFAVTLQAQIYGNDHRQFVRNNVNAGRLVLDAAKAAVRPGSFTSTHWGSSRQWTIFVPTSRNAESEWYWKAVFLA